MLPTEDGRVHKEPHQMRGSELRALKQELETRLRECADRRQCDNLRRRIEELDAEIRRRSRIGRSVSHESQRSDRGGSRPGRPNGANSR